MKNLKSRSVFLSTLRIRLFALWKIPLVWFVRPTVAEFTADRCVIELPFARRNKNHLGSIYFGALCIGGELAVGVPMALMIQERKSKALLVFKDFHADFLKRADGPTRFVFDRVADLEAQLEKAIQSKERITDSYQVEAFVIGKPDCIAKFSVTISVKDR